MPYMLSICSPDAIVISTTSNHLTWLGRDREGVIGHRCSEWASDQSWDLNWHLFQRSCSTGMPLAWDRTVLRADGVHVHGCVMVRPIRTQKQGIVMLCANSIVLGSQDAHPAIDIAECFADLAHIAPIELLQTSFEELASFAAEAASHAFYRLH